MNITITPEFAAALITVLVGSMGATLAGAWRAYRAVKRLRNDTPRTATVTAMGKRLDAVEARLIKAYASIDLLEDENTLLRKQLGELRVENLAQRLEMATLREQIAQRDNTILMLRGRVGELEDQVKALQAADTVSVPPNITAPH